MLCAHGKDVGCLHHGLLVLAVLHLSRGQVNDTTLHGVFVAVVDEDIRPTDHDKMLSPVAVKWLLEVQVPFLRDHGAWSDFLNVWNKIEKFIFSCSGQIGCFHRWDNLKLFKFCAGTRGPGIGFWGLLLQRVASGIYQRRAGGGRSEGCAAETGHGGIPSDRRDIRQLAVTDAAVHLAELPVESVGEKLQALGSQLLLSVHQAFNVCRVVAAALAGGDGAFKGGGGDLRGDAGGGAEGPAAEAGGQRVTQRSGDAVTKSLTQQQEVASFLHLVKELQLL